jgi:hypothetical protein
MITGQFEPGAAFQKLENQGRSERQRAGMALPAKSHIP